MSSISKRILKMSNNKSNNNKALKKELNTEVRMLVPRTEELQQPKPSKAMGMR